MSGGEEALGGGLLLKLNGHRLLLQLGHPAIAGGAPGTGQVVVEAKRHRSTRTSLASRRTTIDMSLRQGPAVGCGSNDGSGAFNWPRFTVQSCEPPLTLRRFE